MLCEHSRPFWRMWGTAVWSQAFSKRFPTLKTVLSAASGLIHCGDVRPVFICFIPVQWKANTRCLSWGFLVDFQKSESHLCWAMRDKVSIVFKLCGWSAEVLFTGWKKSFECGEKSGARSRNWVEPDLKTWCSSDGRYTEALIETLRLLKVTVFQICKLRFDFIFRVSRHSKVVRFCKPRKRSICLFQYASYWFLISSLPHQVLEGTVRDLCLINQQTL